MFGCSPGHERERGWRLTAAHYRLPGVSAWLLEDRWPHDKQNPSQLALIDTHVAGLQREVRERVSSEVEQPILAVRVCGATTTTATNTLLCASKTQHSYFDSPGVHQGSLWHLTKTTPVLDLLWMPQPGLLPTPAPWSCPIIHALHPLPMDVLAFWRADASLSLLPPPTFHFFHLETFPH